MKSLTWSSLRGSSLSAKCELGDTSAVDGLSPTRSPSSALTFTVSFFGEGKPLLKKAPEKKGTNLF